MIEPLIEMTRTLGLPGNDYVIIGEGNTSFCDSETTYWVKASGYSMLDIGANGFVHLYMEPVLALLDNPVDNVTMSKIVAEARVDPEATAKPSVEATFHAMLLHECGVKYVGHTHPMAVNRLLCSTRAEEFAKKRLFPDQIVLCGPESVYVPYTDPGLPLAIAIRDGVREHMSRYMEPPKTILMQNHGLIALANTPSEVIKVTMMCVKAAHIFAGACAVGEPVFLPTDVSEHIYTRADEVYRRKMFAGQ